MSSPGEIAASSGGPHLVTHRQVVTLYGVIGAFLGLAVLAVICRVVALYLKRSYGKWDDWTMLFCILPTTALAGVTIAQAHNGYVGPRTRTPLIWLEDVLIDTWSIQILTIVSLYVVKLSVCFRYLRISEDLRNRFWRLTLVTMALLSLHTISSFLVWLLQCLPVRRFWNPTVPGKCIHQTTWILTVGAFQLATDVLVLLLPVRTIWNLTMPIRTRLAILSIFLVGGVSTIAGCIRFYNSYRFWRGTDDPGGVTLAIEIWSYIEICLAMFCGCAPSFKTIYASVRGTLQKPPTRTTTNEFSANTNSTGRSSTTKYSFFSCGKKDEGSFDGSALGASDDVELMSQRSSTRPPQRDSVLPSPLAGGAKGRSFLRPMSSELATRVTV